MTIYWLPFERRWVAICGRAGYIIGPCRWQWTAILFGLVFCICNKSKL